MLSKKQRAAVKIQSKRNVELWIYSFADMYMILSVFFIALSVIYGAKIKEEVKIQLNPIASAGRGPASLVSDLQIEFERESAELTETAVNELRLFLPVLKGLQGGRIDVEGYADQGALSAHAPFTSKLDLSSKRAVTVAEWLLDNGVPAKFLRTYSYGTGAQFSKDNVQNNRRVVIKISAEVARE